MTKRLKASAEDDSVSRFCVRTALWLHKRQLCFDIYNVVQLPTSREASSGVEACILQQLCLKKWPEYQRAALTHKQAIPCLDKALPLVGKLIKSNYSQHQATGSCSKLGEAVSVLIITWIHHHSSLFSGTAPSYCGIEQLLIKKPQSAPVPAMSTSRHTFTLVTVKAWSTCAVGDSRAGVFTNLVLLAVFLVTRCCTEKHMEKHSRLRRESGTPC